MKSFVIVLVVVAFMGGSVFACNSQHGNAAAASLNQIFGQKVAEGENGRGGDHGVFLQFNGQTNSNFTNGRWSDGQGMINWLLSVGAQIKGSNGHNKNSSNVREG